MFDHQPASPHHLTASTPIYHPNRLALSWSVEVKTIRPVVPPETERHYIRTTTHIRVITALPKYIHGGAPFVSDTLNLPPNILQQNFRIALAFRAQAKKSEIRDEQIRYE